MSHILTEIQKGQYGKGLLIENDGYVLPNSVSSTSPIMAPKNLKEGMENGNGKWYVPQPFIVNAVFQKYGIKNANGRIYPEETLKQQVIAYQKLIDERSSYGECFPADALVKMSDGSWKRIDEVKEGDSIKTLNLYTNNVENNPVKRMVKKEDCSNMITISDNKNIKDTVTLKHKYPLFKKTGEFVCTVMASDIMTTADYNDLYIKISEDGKPSDNDIKVENLTVTLEDYKESTYCPEVENHTWYVKYADMVPHWTHNCNHPESSSIDLSRVSHLITELHWEEHTLVGQMEIFLSNKFIQDGTVCTCGDQVANLIIRGYKIGVSSRGVGSVKDIMGTTVVGDDYELICWDVVSSPSTPGSYIDCNMDNLQQYIESKDYSLDKHNMAIREKLERINKILL